MSQQISKTGSSTRQGALSAFGQLVLIRLKEFIRRPEAVFWVYFFPLLMMVVLGFAFQNKPVEEIKIDIRSDIASDLRDKIESVCQANEHVTLLTCDAEECVNRLIVGKSDFYVREPLADETSDRSDLQMVYVFDPTRPGSIAAKEKFDNLLQKSAGRSNSIQVADHEFEEKGGRYINWLIPGLLGMGLMGGGLWGVGFAIVDMRIRKLLKRFLATPMRRSHFLIAIMTSRLLFMVPEMVLLVFFAWLAFGVEVSGSLLAVVFLILLGSLQFSGIGLLIASRCRTMESVSGLMNLTMLPMWTLSGIFFSYERFPEAVHPFIQALPLTPLIDALRRVMVEGTSIFVLWPQIVVMLIWTILSFALALKIFRWGD